MDRFGKIIERVAEGQPSWSMPEIIQQIVVSGTGLKKFTGHLGGYPIWVLKADMKIYRDVFGWISVGWGVNPVVENNRWTVRSEISFAPASSGSFANEKFEEFKKVVDISGERKQAIFGIEVRVLEVEPNDMNAFKEIHGVIERHAADLGKAKRYWKEQAVIFKKTYGGLA